MNWQELQKSVDAAIQSLRVFRGSLRMLRPIALDAHVTSDFEALAEDTPLVRRFPKVELARMHGEMRAELEGKRRAAGGVARKRASEVAAVVARGRELVAAARKDVRRSMDPDLFNHHDATAMRVSDLIGLQLVAMLKPLPLGEKFQIYREATQRRDVRAYHEMVILEGWPIEAATAAERPTAKAYREFTAYVQDGRVPEGAPDLTGLERELSRLNARADAISLQPVDPDRHVAAGESYGELLEEMTAAGAADDATDQAALREEMSA